MPTLIFLKYRWSGHYFSVWSLGNSQKLRTTNQFLVSTIFFTIMNISFFSLRFDLFSIIAKEVNQIRNNEVCVAPRLVIHMKTLETCNSSVSSVKRLQCRCFPVNFAKFFKKKTLFKKHLQTTASGFFPFT